MVSDRADPRITRTVGALRQTVVELASERSVSQITVADLESGHRREDRCRAEGAGPELLHLAVCEVADCVERDADLYRQTLGDPTDRGAYDAMVRHFNDYALAYLARSTGR